MAFFSARRLIALAPSTLVVGAISALLAATSLIGCGAPLSTTVDDGLLIQSQAELKSLNNLDECPDLNGTYHRKDDASVTREMLIGMTKAGVAKMSIEKSSRQKSATTENTKSEGSKVEGPKVDGYTIDGLRHFSRAQGARNFDYLAICTQNRLRVSIFEGESNIHNVLYIKTLEGFDIQQSGEFGASLTQWLPAK